MFKINKKIMAILAAMVISFTCLVPMTAFATNYIYISNNSCANVVGSGSGGNFSVTWTNCTFIAGRGWQVGNASRVLNYNAGIWKNNGGLQSYSHLGAYGWTRNPLIEYRVIDSWFNWRPVYGSSKGTVSSDGGTYDIYKNTQVNQPSIIGITTFDQFWSVRQSQRTQGQNNTITFANHVNAWKSKGLNLGATWDFQIIAVEGYQSTGQANVTIW